MKTGPIAHGVLLVVVLIFGYQTWTKEKKVKPKTGNVAVWTGSVDSLVSVTFETSNPKAHTSRKLTIERRDESGQTYYWGKETRSRRAPKKANNAGHGHGHGHGHDEAKKDDAKKDGAKKGDAKKSDAKKDDAKKDDAKKDDAKKDDAKKDDAKAPEPEEEPELVTTTREFPIGEKGMDMLEALASLKALRTLGKVEQDRLEEYELHEQKDIVTVAFKSGTHTLIIGGRVYKGSNRYAMTPNDERAFTIAGTTLQPLYSGEHGVKLQKVHAYKPEDVSKIAIKVAEQTRELVRTEVKDAKGTRQSWALADSPDKADQTMKLFVEQIDKLRPSQYERELDAAKLTTLTTLTYFDKSGKQLGRFELFKLPPEPKPEQQETADNNKPKPEANTTTPGGPPHTKTPPGDNKPGSKTGTKVTEKAKYYIRTEHTRIYGLVSAFNAEKVEDDLKDIF